MRPLSEQLGPHAMRDMTYLIRFKMSDLGPHLVIAQSAEVHRRTSSSSDQMAL
jgi:hypothetical protein